MLLPNYQINSISNYTYRPNSSAVHPQNGIKFHFNLDGYIGENFHDRDSSKFRIAIVGDSFVSGAYYTSYYTNFCIELQRLFIENGYNVEVLNCGIDGARRSYSNYLSVKDRVVKLNPDMILLSSAFPLFDENIIKEYHRGYRIDYPRSKDSIYYALRSRIDDYTRFEKFCDFFYKAYIGKAMAKAVMKNSPHGSRPRDYAILCMKKHIFRKDTSVAQTFTQEETIEKYDSLNTYLKQQNIRFFLLKILDSESEINTNEICKTNHLPLINLGITLNRNQGDIFPNDHHPTQQGNIKIASKLYSIMAKNTLIPSRFIIDSLPTNRSVHAAL